MTNPELTGEQIKELQKKYRYVRFVSDKDDPKTFILQATDAVGRGKKVLWKPIEIPEIKGKSRSVMKFYAFQIVDLQVF